MISRNRAFLPAGLALTLLAATPGAATIPGNIEQRAYAGLLHVCEDEEPGDDGYFVCDEQPGGDDQAPYTGSECVAQSLPPVCVIDFIPKVRIKGRVTIVNDDAAFDSFGASREASALVIELKAGKRKATLVEIFDFTAIGNWNPFGEVEFNVADPDDLSIEFTNGAGTAFQFANGNLFEVGLELRALATQWFPKAAADLAGAVAVLTGLEPDSKRDPLVHDDSADTLASAATFKVVIEFARARP